MEVVFVLAKGSYFKENIKVEGEWPHQELPHKGNIFQSNIPENLIDWDKVSKEDVLAAMTDDNMRKLWNYKYVVCVNEGENSHALGMKDMMYKYFMEMCKVGNIKWSLVDNTLIPEIWLESIYDTGTLTESTQNDKAKNTGPSNVFVCVIALEVIVLQFIIFAAVLFMRLLN